MLKCVSVHSKSVLRRLARDVGVSPTDQPAGRSRKPGRLCNPRRKRNWLLVWGLVFVAGCQDAELRVSGDSMMSEAAALAHSTMASTALGVAQSKWRHVPVPPEGGPLIAPIALLAPVYEAPNKDSDPIGYLRLGEKVERSEAPVSESGCPGGWYAIRPVGFMCNDHHNTLKMDHPLVRAFPHGPDRSKPMPYSYGFLRAVAPNYLRIPSEAEQYQYEMGLERHLNNYERFNERWDRLVHGANSVPLLPSGAGAGDVSPEARVPDMNHRYGGDGDDRVPWWLEGERRIPNISSFRAPAYAVIADRVKRHAGVSLIGSFVAGDDALKRRFAIAVDGRLIPTDKIKADGGSRFHGVELGDTPLPVAFPWRDGAKEWDDHLHPKGRVPLREMISLTGEVRRSGGTRFVKTRAGTWLRSQDIKTAPAPSQLPWFARNKTRWIDISILNQTLVLYEGSKPVYVTLVSTGRDGLGDPDETLSTPTGTFRIYQKHVTTTMDSSVADNEFELRDVPWVMYFKGGYAIHGAYWHDDFGRPRSHGCVNLAPVDARYVFNWASPDTPRHFHASYSGETFGRGTLIHIHP